MYILTIAGKEKEGAYSVPDGEGDKILYLFTEEDDALRYAMMLEEKRMIIQKCMCLKLKMRL